MQKNRKNNKRIIIGGILATVIGVATLSSLNNINENTSIFEDINILSTNERSSKSARYDQSEIDAAYAAWNPVTTITSGGSVIGVETTNTVTHPTYVTDAYVDFYNNDTSITTSIDVTGEPTFKYYFNEPGTYDVKVRVSLDDNTIMRTSIGTGIVVATIEDTLDLFYGPWKTLTPVVESSSNIGFTTSGTVDLTNENISSVNLNIYNGTTLYDSVQLDNTSTSETLEYYFMDAGTYDIKVETKTVSNDVYETDLQIGFVAGSAAIAAETLVQPMIDGTSLIASTVTPTSNVGYKTTAPVTSSSATWIEDINIIQENSTGTDIVESMDSSGFQQFSYAGTTDLIVEVVFTNGQTWETQAATGVATENIKVDTDAWYNSFSQEFLIDKSGVTFTGTTPKPDWITTTEFIVIPQLGTDGLGGDDTTEGNWDIQTPTATDLADGYTFNFLSDGFYRFASRTTLENGDIYMSSITPDASLNPIASTDGVFQGWRSKKPDVDAVFANVASAVTTPNHTTDITITDAALDMAGASDFDPATEITSAVLEIKNSAGDVVNKGGAGWQIVGNTTAGKFSYTFDVPADDTYTINIATKLLNGAEFDTSIISTPTQAYKWRDVAEFHSVFDTLSLTDVSLDATGAPASTYGYTLNVAGTPDYVSVDDASWLGSYEVKVVNKDDVTIDANADDAIEGTSTTTHETATIGTFGEAVDLTTTKSFVDGATYQVWVKGSTPNGQEYEIQIGTDFVGHKSWLSTEVDSWYVPLISSLTKGTYSESVGYTTPIVFDSSVDLTNTKIDLYLNGGTTPVHTFDPTVVGSFNFLDDGLYNAEATTTLTSGEVFTTTIFDSNQGYRERTLSGDVTPMYTNLTVGPGVGAEGTANAKAVATGTVDVTDTLISESTLQLYNDDNVAVGSSYDLKTNAAAVDYSFNFIEVEDEYQFKVTTKYSNGQEFIDELHGAQFTGYLEVTKATIEGLYDALKATIAYDVVDGSNGETNTKVTFDASTFASTDWLSTSDINIYKTSDLTTPVATFNLYGGTPVTGIQEYAFDEDTNYTIEAHTTLINGVDYTFTLTSGDGFAHRDQATYIEPLFNDITGSMNGNATEYTLSGVMGTDTDSVVTTATVDITENGGDGSNDQSFDAKAGFATPQVVEFTSDNTYDVNIIVTITNGAKYTINRATGMQAYRKKDQAEVDKIYLGSDGVIGGADDKFTFVTNPDGSTDLTINGTTDAIDYVTEAKLYIKEGDWATGTPVGTTTGYDITANVTGGTAITEISYDFENDTTYTVGVTTSTNDGGTWDTVLQTGIQGYVLRTQDDIDDIYKDTDGTVDGTDSVDSSALLVDNTSNTTTVTISGSLDMPTWVESSTLYLVNDGTDTTQTVDLKTAGATVDETLIYELDGTNYSLEVLTTLVSGQTVSARTTLDGGDVLVGWQDRTNADVDPIYAGITLAEDTTNHGSLTFGGTTTLAANTSWITKSTLYIEQVKDITGAVPTSPIIKQFVLYDGTTVYDVPTTPYLFEDDGTYDVYIETELANGQTINPTANSGWTGIIGYKDRESEIDGLYNGIIEGTLSTSDVADLTDDGNTQINVSPVSGKTFVLPEWVASSTMELYKGTDISSGTLVSGTTVTLTDGWTGPVKYQFTEDGDYLINIHTVLDNGTERDTVLWSGYGYRAWTQSEIESSYAGYSHALSNDATTITISGSPMNTDIALDATTPEVIELVGTTVATTPVTLTNGVAYNFVSDDVYNADLTINLENGASHTFAVPGMTDVKGYKEINDQATEVDALYSFTLSDTVLDTTQVIVSGTYGPLPEKFGSATIQLVEGTTYDSAKVVSTESISLALDGTTDPALDPILFDGLTEGGTYTVWVNTEVVYSTTETTLDTSYQTQIGGSIVAWPTKTQAEVDTLFDSKFTIDHSTDETILTADATIDLPDWVEKAEIYLVNTTEATEVDANGPVPINDGTATNYSYTFLEDGTYRLEVRTTLKNGQTMTPTVLEDNIEGWKGRTETEINNLYAPTTTVAYDPTTYEPSVIVSGTYNTPDWVYAQEAILLKYDVSNPDGIQVGSAKTISPATGADQTLDVKFTGTTDISSGDGQYRVDILTYTKSDPSNPIHTIAELDYVDDWYDVYFPKTETDIEAFYNPTTIVGDYDTDSNKSKATITSNGLTNPEYVETATAKIIDSTGDVVNNGTEWSQDLIANSTINANITFPKNDDYWLVVDVTLKNGQAGRVFIYGTDGAAGVEGWVPTNPDVLGTSITATDNGHDDLFHHSFTLSGTLSATEFNSDTAWLESATVNLYRIDETGVVMGAGPVDSFTMDLPTDGTDYTIPADTKLIDNEGLTPEQLHRVSISWTAKNTNIVDPDPVVIFDDVGTKMEESFNNVELGYSEDNNSLSIQGDIDKSQLTNVNSFEIVLYKDGEVYATKVYDNSQVSRATYSDDQYIHIDEEFILTETGNYSVEINVTTTSGNIISIDKGSQEVEKIIETEVPTVEEESSIGILGWTAIISTVLLVPMFIATLISKLKRR